MNASTSQIKEAIRSKYAWPGGYPLYLICCDGEALCCDCARKKWKQIAYSTRNKLRDGWHVIGPDVNWEDPALFCAHCNTRIHSAYAEDLAEGKR
jgi:hypothetical protein